MSARRTGVGQPLRQVGHIYTSSREGADSDKMADSVGDRVPMAEVLSYLHHVFPISCIRSKRILQLYSEKRELRWWDPCCEVLETWKRKTHAEGAMVSAGNAHVAAVLPSA